MNKVEVLEETNVFINRLNPNHMVVRIGSHLRFLSYDRVVADYDRETEHLKLYYSTGENKDLWCYSPTTTRYFKLFINNHTHLTYENKAQFERVIKSA